MFYRQFSLTPALSRWERVPQGAERFQWNFGGLAGKRDYRAWFFILHPFFFILHPSAFILLSSGLQVIGRELCGNILGPSAC
jgi:hypothetical protein